MTFHHYRGRSFHVRLMPGPLAMYDVVGRLARLKLELNRSVNDQAARAMLDIRARCIRARRSAAQRIRRAEEAVCVKTQSPA